MIVVAGMSDRVALQEVGAFARRVEALGFDALHVPETIHDSLSVALLALEHTSTLRVQTSLTLAFVRSPMLVALQSWDLSRSSHGRFDLGLGTQIRQNIEQRFGIPWTDPIERMSDYVTAVRACWHSFSEGSPLDVRTGNYQLTRLQPFFNPGPLDHPGPRLMLGGVNRAAVSLAGRCADTFVTHPTNSHPRYLADVARPLLDRSATQAGRHPEDVTIVAASPWITGRLESDLLTSRESQRAILAFLYSTPAYRLTLDLFGWSDLGAELQVLTRSGRWDRLGDLLSDDILDVLVPCALWEDLPRVASEWFADVADGILLQPPASEDPDLDVQFADVVTRLRSMR